MSSVARIEVTIELEPDSEHVRGTVRREDGEEAPFVGWLSLMALLQAAAAPTVA